MKVYPLHPHAALLLEDTGTSKRYVAISDLHIGIEAEIGTKGITVASNLVQEMLDELLSIIESCKSLDGLILLGDIKNTVGSISRQEWNDIPEFFRTISSRIEVYLVPGNHDSNIRFLVTPPIHVVSSRGMVLGDTLLVHGHSMPSRLRAPIKRIVMGHVHPVFFKKESVLNGERVWVSLKVQKDILFSERGTLDIIIVPSFNNYLYVSAEGAKYHKSISPIITRVFKDFAAVNEGNVITLDGSIIGDLSTIRSIL